MCDFTPALPNKGQPHESQEGPNRLRMVIAQQSRWRRVSPSSISGFENPVRRQETEHPIKRHRICSRCPRQLFSGLRGLGKRIGNAEVRDCVQASRGPKGSREFEELFVKSGFVHVFLRPIIAKVATTKALR